MPRVTIGELATLITARTEPFERATKRAKTKTKEFEKSIEQSSKRLSQKFSPAISKAAKFLSGPLGLTVGLGTVTGAMTQFGRSILAEGQALDAIGKLSTRVGVSTKDLMALKFIANQTGAEFAQVQRGLQSFSKRLGEAAMGTGEARVALEQLNIDAAEFIKLPMIERLKIISDRLADMSTESEKAAIAARLFSDVGKQELLNMLRLGGDEIEAMTKRAKELGLVMEDEVVKAIETTNDRLEQLKLQAAGIKTQLAGELLPALGASIKEFQELQKRFGLEGAPGKILPDMEKVMGGVGRGVRAVPGTLPARVVFEGLGKVIEEKRAEGEQLVQEERAKLLDEKLRKTNQLLEAQAKQEERQHQELIRVMMTTAAQTIGAF